MIYVVNKRTKEHRIADIPQGMNGWVLDGCDDIWDVVQADSDGWIPWRCCPDAESPLPDGTPYETKHESGGMFKGEKPETFRSHWRGYGDAVIAYRPTLENETPKAKEPEQLHVGGNLLWQDAEGTIPARDGDPVGRIDCDMTGNVMQSSGSGRPVYREPEAPEWDGAGLPPVGTECEVKHTGEWRATRIVGIDEGRPVFKTDWHDRYVYASGDDFEFRPLRTAAQRAEEEAAEEMAPTIRAAANDVYTTVNGSAADSIARALYRAGYRKTGGE